MRRLRPSSPTLRRAEIARAAALLALAAAGCAERASSVEPADAGPDSILERRVSVTLDGVPVAGATVMQGGNPERWTTDETGMATVSLDLAIEEVGELVLMAAHPEARTRFEPDLGRDGGPSLAIALQRFERDDNEAYAFGDPGEPERKESTAQCAHCHATLNADWVQTPHRFAAKNPVVQDFYVGTASAFGDPAACAAAGGSWLPALEPGTRALVSRCQLGDGALPALNPGCGSPATCADVATERGACADCHAPGIDGALGGRDLLEATGLAYEYGVHCDVCHRVESVRLDQKAGVAGRLLLLRPSEKPPTPGLGEWLPITFGPWPDVANPFMGAVEREHFHDGTLCAGCHELEQTVLVPAATIDSARWPDGKLPIHSTFSEWASGKLSGAPCPSCHMPPDPSVGNGADLYNAVAGPEGVAAGWRRAPGSVRRHVWLGPRHASGGLEKLAAALFIDKSVDGGELVARVTVKNVGCGHAIPTGEPLRSLVLDVEARCGAESVPPAGGDVVPDFGGYLEQKLAGADWSVWPSAKPGDRVRVIARTGKFRDYSGFGPFGDGRFSAAEKGMPEERLVGVRRVVDVQGGQVSFDAPLPAGDVAYLGDDAEYLAGAPGFGFARVLVAADGRRMVPHFLAVDVASDNRLLPQDAFTTEHRFVASCADPEVVAVLRYRAYPPELARQRGFERRESVIAEARR